MTLFWPLKRYISRSMGCYRPGFPVTTIAMPHCCCLWHYFKNVEQKMLKFWPTAPTWTISCDFTFLVDFVIFRSIQCNIFSLRLQSDQWCLNNTRKCVFAFNWGKCWDLAHFIGKFDVLQRFIFNPCAFGSLQRKRMMWSTFHEANPPVLSTLLWIMLSWHF